MARIYTDQEKREIAREFAKSPLGLVKFAKSKGICHKTVQKSVNDLFGESPKTPPALKILTYDVETSYMTLEYNSYDLRVNLKRHSIDHIKRDWWMLGAAWKWLGDKEVDCISVNPKDPENDYGVILKLHEVLSQADILVGHNSDAFDYKKFNARAILYNLPPIQPKQSIDTLKIARQNFKFSSNTLRYIADVLGVGMKDESPDWDKVIAGCPEALRYMRKYNKQDVIVTEKVYLKLRPYMKNHPNLNVYLDLKAPDGSPIPCCKSCGSVNILRSESHKYTRAGKYAYYQCGDCGSWSESKKNQVKVDLR
jgi:DNA polymerase elongation subunit (family B)